MKKIILLIVVMAIIGFVITSSAHTWPFYSKPAFRGRVIDAETKEPIEGAVVVVLYYKCFLIGNPGGPNPHIIKAKELLTDEKGEFYFPSYFALTPFSKDDGANFIFYKPGYKSISRVKGINIPPETYLSIEKDMIGKEGEIQNKDMYGDIETWKGVLGIVELEKAITREDRRISVPSRSSLKAEQLPILFKMIQEEDQYLYK